MQHLRLEAHLVFARRGGFPTPPLQILAVPFFASGVCISLLLFHGARDANRLYAADLCSSALGAT